MDNEEVYFREKQSFNQWWLYAIVLGVDLLIFNRLYHQYRLEENLPTSPELYISAAIVLLVTWLIFSSKLETIIKADGIYAKFFPFHWSWRHYKWPDISKCYVRKYSPIAEYGGWGLRLGMLGKGRAFNVSGDKGLQLELSNGKRLLIGTQMPDELTSALAKSGRLAD
ncbi:MAG: hypothetical protein K0S09_1203 [Sphingobacteriaceae bacterium]|jgi:hypothetical protein|nr:hypothetical protein [Sphingobacteriaceae bacterium]